MFPDLLGKPPRVLSASRKPRNRISLLPPTRIPLRSPFTISSRNAFYYLTIRPGITASPLRPASSSRHSCILRHPAFSCVILHSPVSSCVLLRHPAFSCIILRSPAFSCVHPAFSCVILRLRLASSAVSSSLECSVSSLDRNKSIPLPASIFPCVPIIRSPFRNPFNPSILLPVPRVQFRGDFVSGLSKSSSPFLSPFSASLRIRSSIIPSSSLLPSAVSAVISWSPPPFVALKAVVCFSSPPSSPNCSYRVPSSRRLAFVYKSVLVTLNQ